MRRSIQVASLLVAFALPVLARNPPPATPGPPPPIWDTRGREETDMTPANHDGVGLVPVPRPWMSGAMLPRPTNGAHGTGTDSIASPTPPAHPPFRFATENIPSSISPQYTAHASSLSGDESEPSLVTINKSGVDHTILSYQADPGTHFFSLHVAMSTNLTSSNAAFTTTSPAVPSGYTDGFDSTLVENPFTDGARPGAVYLTALLAYQPFGNAGTRNPMQIRTWASDDGGSTWSGGQAVASTASSADYILDKPVTDVSWFQGTRGYLYVAWVEFPSGASNASRITMRRNTNGLWQRCRPVGGGCDTAWDAPITINDGRFADGAYAPQVVVNPDNGHVYMFWVSSATGAVQMRRSTDAGSTFQPELTVPPITIVQGVKIIHGVGNHGYLLNGLRAVVVPSIKWNSGAHNVMMAWHARTANELTNQTALYFLSFNPDTISSPQALPAPFNDAAESQIQPAIDNDDNGNVLVSYFTTQNASAPNFDTYQVYGVGLTAGGQVLAAPTPLQASSYPAGFTGDYHETFFWTFADALTSRWNTSWARNSGGFDTMVTGVK